MIGANIRRAMSSDVHALKDIYNYYVLHTHITFDLEPRTLDERLRWFAKFEDSGRYQCVVAEKDGKVIGWASSGPFKDRAAYDTSVETSVYLAPAETGRGIGRCLYETLLNALEKVDVHMAYGGISQPNPASVHLHESLGFELAGLYREVGRKFGRFWDVAVYQRPVAAKP
jgi:phosphinothricin acetyltransferase